VTATTDRRDALVERLIEATVGTWDLLAVYLGSRLDLYRALADTTPTRPRSRPPSDTLLGAGWRIAWPSTRGMPPSCRESATTWSTSTRRCTTCPIQLTCSAVPGLLAEGGSVVIGDERVGDKFTAPGDELERFYYGFSVLHCLPVGLVGEGAAGTGTVMRADTVKRYAEEAGFAAFEILPIENDFYRFYRLVP
jgi:hypothetical protein